MGLVVWLNNFRYRSIILNQGPHPCEVLRNFTKKVKITITIWKKSDINKENQGKWELFRSNRLRNYVKILMYL